MKTHLVRVMTALFLLFLTVSPLVGEDVFGVILYADGSEISIFRNGSLRTYDVFADDVIGMPLLEGDLVQTENGTFLEVQLLPSRSTLKIAENTSFQIQQIAQNGGGNFDLLYGRVRAKVERVGSADPFQIRGRQAVAGVRGTDFGFDYVVERGSFTNPVTQVYCFEGSVEVEAAEPDGAEDSGEPGTDPADPDAAGQGGQEPGSQPQAAPTPQPVRISANQMVSLRTPAPQSPASGEETGEPGISGGQVGTQAGRSPVIQQSGIETAINSFWQENNFKTQPVDVEKINQEFPQLKVKILQARREIQLAAERRALQQGDLTPEELQNRVKELELPEPSFADTITSLPVVSIESVYPEIQPRILQRNPGRTAGVILTGAGAFSGISGIIVALWGQQIFETPGNIVDDISIGLFAGAGVSLAVGLPLYFINILP